MKSGVLPVPSKQQGISKMILHGKELLTQRLLIFSLFCVTLWPCELYLVQDISGSMGSRIQGERRKL